mmetsp:Transcript_34823/g.97703  ORF Transcript_34823/g.97703 Transcript_34823/m.97703 type:complete len:319 (+) Transcript_34823:1444-2400(+)
MPTSSIPSMRMSFVTCTAFGASLRRVQICIAVSPSLFLASREAPRLTRTRSASSLPRLAACIIGVQPFPSVALGSRPRSSRQFKTTGSSSTVAQCTAVKPSRSLLAMLAPASTREGNSCQWPSRAAMLRAVAPSTSAWLTSRGGSISSGCVPSRFWSSRFTRSKCPETQACIRTLLFSPSNAPASHLAPPPLLFCTSATTQAIWPRCAAWWSGVSPRLLMKSADGILSVSTLRGSKRPSSAAMWIAVSPLQSPSVEASRSIGSSVWTATNAGVSWASVTAWCSEFRPCGSRCRRMGWERSPNFRRSGSTSPSIWVSIA